MPQPRHAAVPGGGCGTPRSLHVAGVHAFGGPRPAYVPSLWHSWHMCVVPKQCHEAREQQNLRVTRGRAAGARGREGHRSRRRSAGSAATL